METPALRLAGALSALVALSGCANSQLASSVSPSANRTTNPAAVVGDLPVWSPVPYVNDPVLATPDAAGGFVHFPGGVFRRDPHADMVLDRTLPHVVRTRTPDQPYLYAGEGSPVRSDHISFDRVVGRWLPVTRAQVSANGLRYAYLDYESATAAPWRIHIVDIRSAADQIVRRAAQALLAIVGVTDHDIFLTDCHSTEVSGNCSGPLWRVDIATGSVATVSDHRGAWIVNGSVAWLVTCWPSKDPVPCFGVYGEEQFNQLLRVDVASGREEVWYGASGVNFLGTDVAGRPIVAVNVISPGWHGVTGSPWGDAGESVVFRLTVPEDLDRLFSVRISEPWAGFFTANADATGIWLQADYVPPGFQTAVLYLYASASGGQEMSHNFGATLVGPFG